jgi:predicted Rossmann fold flavoprotein
VLITHAGLSGPAILRLSAWGARSLHRLNYQFALRINWFPDMDERALAERLDSIRAAQSARLVVNSPLPPLAVRLWQKLVLAAGISGETRWAELSRAGRHHLIQQLSRTKFQVSGKSLNQEEFVTCGGGRLNEVNFKTMESRLCSGLYLGGELLDVDGLTGGFNFQSAWTTGWLAGRAMSGISESRP